MNSLHTLVPSGKKKKRVGRGGDRGGTSGKGHKGQKARSGGYVRRGFEGGQMPLARRLPKRGFNNAAFKTEYDIVNLDQLEVAFEAGQTVDRDALIEKGIVKKSACLIKILGDGTFAKKLAVHAHAFSKTAQDRISAAGGTAHILEEK